MENALISEIIEHLTTYNRLMYDYGKDTRHYGTDQKLRIDQIHIVDYIGKHPGCSLGAIADDTDSLLSTVSLQVKRLIKLGLIQKTRSKSDQREVILTLTPEGITNYKYHEKTDQEWVDFISELLSSYQDEELTNINSFLKMLVTNTPKL